MENNELKNKETVIEVIDGGALKITGNFILKDLKREVTVAPEEVCLCRCGLSSNKPFCDESHKR